MNSRPNRLRCIRHLRLHETPNLGVHETGSRPGRAAVWLTFTLLALGPLATWGLQHAVVEVRAAEAKRVNAEPIVWNSVSTKGRSLLLTWSDAALDAKARERGFGATYSFRSDPKRSWYVRYDAGRPGPELDGPDDFVEIALGRHREGKRYAADGPHPRNPTRIHVYDTHDGQRRLLGSRIVERYQVPAFPPQLDVDGSWVPDRAKTREPREEAMIARIVDEIPQR